MFDIPNLAHSQCVDVVYIYIFWYTLQVSSSVPSSAAQVVMTGLNASELANRLKEIPSMQVSQSGLIDVAKIKQELQHQEVAKSPGGLHEKFEPCVVCGDRASG